MHRRIHTILFSAAAAAILLGCGGGSSNPAPQPVSKDCSGTPAIAAVAGYPVYKLPDGAIDSCSVKAYYEAGYAIMSNEDVEPWSDPDGSTQVATAYTEQVIPPSGAADDLIISHSAGNPPAYTNSNTLNRFVLARSADGSAPYVCSINAFNEDELNSKVDACLATLRNPPPPAPQKTAQGSGVGTIMQKSAAGNLLGEAEPDPNAWTLLGTEQKTIVAEIEDRWYLRSELLKQGDVTVRMSLYRLNSVSQKDYYLVRAMWTTVPKTMRNETCGRFTPCGFFNNDHRLSFRVDIKRGDKLMPTSVVSFMPQTVVRNTTITSKIGGGLKFGSGGAEASATSEVSSSYSYNAANIISGPVDGTLHFRVAHATATDGDNLFASAPTTVGTMTTTAWGLFEASAPQGSLAPDDVVLTLDKMEGDFGHYTAPLLYGGVVLVHYKARAEADGKPLLTFNFSPPELTVSIKDANGNWEQIDVDAATPLMLKRDQSVSLKVNGGVSSTTGVALSWKLLNIPGFVVSSVDSGAGNRIVNLTAKATAEVGAFDYLRINTTPLGAAPQVRDGAITIPIKIVQ